MASQKRGRISQKNIRESLQGQLTDKGMSCTHYQELVNDYVKLWVIAGSLQEDINKRGCKVEKLDSRGQMQVVNNESIDQLIKTQASMLRILEVLGLSAPKPKSGEMGGGGNDLL